MRKLIVAIILGASALASAVPADAWTRSGSFTGPRGTTSWGGSGSCSGGSCTRSGGGTGTHGRSWSSGGAVSR
jgi:hypothetical protein